jgi:surface antigen
VAEISDDVLMAYADGQLESAEAKRLAELLAADEALRRRFAKFAATKPARLARVFDGAVETDVPEQLLKAAAAFDAALRKRSEPQTSRLSGWLRGMSDGLAGMMPAGMSPAWGALGIAVTVVVVAIGARLAAERVPEPDVFRAALETARSGDAIRFTAEDGDRLITPQLSFLNKTGDFCRKYAITRADRSQIEGVACRDGAGTWRVDMEAEGGPAVDRSKPSLADSGSSMAIEERIGELIKGPVFGRDEEARALKSGWTKN